MRTLLIAFFLQAAMVSAQNTMQLAEGEKSPKASLEEVSWITGHWQGEAFGGLAEEIWSEPKGGSMMFVFRLVHNDQVSFYEVGHIQEIDGSLILQLKHFHSNLKGWEEKNETVDFKLVKMEKNKVFFEGLTMEKVSKNQMDVWVLIEQNNTSEEVLFAYTRQ